MAAQTWAVRIDGASRGNPGAAAYALVIERPGMPPYEEAVRLGDTTNNIAEYTALVRALERAAQLGGDRLDIFSDSELLVKQMNGEYRVKNEDLKSLYLQAQERLKSFEKVTIRHVRRAQNSRADALCNEALDGRPVPPSATAMTSAAPALATSSPGIRNHVVEHLRAAAWEWAKGDASQPDPSVVWDELWAIVTSAVSRSTTGD